MTGLFFCSGEKSATAFGRSQNRNDDKKEKNEGSLNRNKSKCMLFGNRCIETQVQVLIDDFYVSILVHADPQKR